MSLDAETASEIDHVRLGASNGERLGMAVAAAAVLFGGVWLWTWFDASGRYQDALAGAQAARSLYAESLTNEQLDELVVYAHTARRTSWEESADVVAAFVRSGFSDIGTIKGLIDAAARDVGLPYGRAACDLASSRHRRVL